MKGTYTHQDNSNGDLNEISGETPSLGATMQYSHALANSWCCKKPNQHHGQQGTPPTWNMPRDSIAKSKVQNRIGSRLDGKIQTRHWARLESRTAAWTSNDLSPQLPPTSSSPLWQRDHSGCGHCHGSQETAAEVL